MKGFSLVKIFLITVSVLLIIILVSVMFGSQYDEKTYTIEINGDTSVVVYKGSTYEDPGARAYDDKKVDLSQNINVQSDLNTNKNGRYEITYSIGDISVTRVVRVIDRPISSNGNTSNNNSSGSSSNEVVVKNGETTLTLKGNKTVYIDVYGNYTEEGYTAIDTKDGNITKNVEVTHNVDNTKPGTYYVIYTVKNSSGITTSVKRNIVVMKVEMSLSLVNTNYTNSSVGIKVNITDEYFSHLILPNGEKVTSKNYVYNVSSNGEYKFVSYNKYGAVRELKIKVSTIDKTAPVASCTAEYKNGKTIVYISTSDNIGVEKFVVNGKTYSSTTVSLDSLVKDNNVVVYDKAGNSASTSCTVTQKVFIETLSSKGVIVSATAQKISSEIAGYYFSYNNVRPNKQVGGYVATSNSKIDVVRLPGTTYVWVEDTNGNVSEAGSITLSNDVLLITTSGGYKKLENISLESYLSQSGWSIDELDKLIARSVRAAGLYTKDAAATAAVALQTVLAQTYKIKIPSWWGGKSWAYGADKSWGVYRTKYAEKYDNWYYYYGLDCSGFTTWAYVNAGYNISRGQYPSYWSSGSKIAFSKDNGVPGDFIVSDGHVKLIVGKTSNGYICAEAQGKNQGMCLSNHSYSKSSGYYILKGESIANKYAKVPISSYPTGY